MSRASIYALLITVAVGSAAGRIAAVSRVAAPPREPTPTFGANDRSRWATIRALVDHGTFVIGTRDAEQGDQGIAFEEDWKTIDKVLHPETGEFFSSKPPLLPTLVAGQYWILKQLFGWSITDPDDRWWVVRTILFTVNGFPWLIFLLVIARLAEQFGSTDWGRLFVVVSACFGTLITPFLVTLNNHTIAACTAGIALYAMLRPSSGPVSVAISGLFAGLTAAFELPATCFALFLGLSQWRRSPKQVLWLYAPCALVPILAQLGLNQLALGQFGFAYGHFGTEWYAYEGSHWRDIKGIDAAQESPWVYAFHFLLGHHGAFSLTPIFLLAIAGLPMCLRRESPLRMPALLSLAVSLVVIGFYLARTNNYGGWCCGARWLIWLTPLWLLTMLPAADFLAGRSWGRVVACILLAVSALTASYPTWSPWRHPWLYNLMQACGWQGY